MKKQVYKMPKYKIDGIVNLKKNDVVIKTVVHPFSILKISMILENYFPKASIKTINKATYEIWLQSKKQ